MVVRFCVGIFGRRYVVYHFVQGMLHSVGAGY